MFPNFLFFFVFKGLELLVPHCAGRTRMLCLRFACLVRLSFGSATDARLDTGGWLALTRQGLSPGKHRQAFLGAITPQAEGRRAFCGVPLQRLVRQREQKQT
jgi:hypothetical protein